MIGTQKCSPPCKLRTCGCTPSEAPCFPLSDVSFLFCLSVVCLILSVLRSFCRRLRPFGSCNLGILTRRHRSHAKGLRDRKRMCARFLVNAIGYRLLLPFRFAFFALFPFSNLPGKLGYEIDFLCVGDMSGGQSSIPSFHTSRTPPFRVSGFIHLIHIYS